MPRRESRPRLRHHGRLQPGPGQPRRTVAGKRPHLPSGRVTQQSGGELDYMVASRDMGALGLLYQGHIPGGFSADHYPVEFGVVPLRGAAGFSIGSYSNRSDQERILDVYNNNSANGTHVITYDPLGGGNQKFTFVPTYAGGYNIKNMSTGKCLDLDKGPG